MTIIETDQSTEIKLSEIARGPFVLRYLSYRKSEDAALGLQSEDYIVSNINSRKTIFILCDGVGSSFYGNLGSQILGESLLKWLEKIETPREKKQDVDEWQRHLTQELKSELNNLTSLATNIIQQKELNSDNEMVRLAEATQRDDFGTQSNFACGMIWPRSDSLPDGLILLFWLGNARIRIFNQNVDLTHQTGWGNNPGQLLEVWSSKDGVLGTIYSYTADLSSVTHVIAYSDGLENVDEKIKPNLNGAQLDELVRHSQSIKDDDVTFLELSANNKEVVGLDDDVVPLRNRIQTIVPQKIEQAPKSQPAPPIQKPAYTSSTPTKTSLSLGAQITISVMVAVAVFFAGYLFRTITTDGKDPTPTVEMPLLPPATKIPRDTATSINTNIPTASPTETPTLQMDATSAALTETIAASTQTAQTETASAMLTETFVAGTANSTPSETVAPEFTTTAITPSP